MNCDYFILFREEKKISQINNKDINTIEEFSKVILDLIAAGKPIIIPIEITEIFLEIIFFIFFILTKERNDVSIVVCSNIFEKLKTIINIQSEWLNERFSSAVYHSKEPFSFESYKNFKSYSSIYDVEFVPQILFISHLEYIFLNCKHIFENDTIIAINNNIEEYDYNLNISFEATEEEIYQGNLAKNFLSCCEFELFDQLEDNQHYSIDHEDKNFKLTICRSDSIAITKKENLYNFFVEGTMNYYDFEYYLEAKPSYIKELFAKYRYYKIDNKYYFPCRNIVVYFENQRIFIIKK